MGYLTKRITTQEASLLGFAKLVSTSDPKLFGCVGRRIRIVTAGREYNTETSFEISDKNSVIVSYNGMFAEFSKRVNFWD